MIPGRLLFTAQGVWQWGGGTEMSLEHSNEGGTFVCVSQIPLWVSVEDSPSESAQRALQALDHLLGRIHLELAGYREHMAAMNDDARTGWAQWAEEWLGTGGREIYGELRRKIQIASPTDQDQMAESIRAAERLVDISRQRLATPEDWDVILDWTRGALPSLRRAFRRFKDSAAPELELNELDMSLVQPTAAAWLQEQIDSGSQPSKTAGWLLGSERTSRLGRCATTAYESAAA